MKIDSIRLFHNLWFLVFHLFTVLNWALAIILMFCCAPVFADSNGYSYVDIEKSLKGRHQKFSASLSEIEERITTLKKIESLNAQQQSELSLLSQVDDFLHKSIESTNRAIHYAKSSQNVPQRLKILERKLDEPLQKEELKAENINSKQSLEKLELQFEAIRKKLVDVQNARSEIEQEIIRRAERQSKIEEEIRLTQSRIDGLKQKKESVLNASGDSTLQTQKLVRQAEVNYLTQSIQELDLENRSYNQQRELLRAQRHVAERDVLIAQRNYNVFEEIINRRRAEAAARTKQVADTASEVAGTAHPLILTIIDENKQLAAELESVIANNALLGEEKKRLDQVLTRTQRSYDRIREKIAQTGQTNAIGIKLRKDRRQLHDIDVHEKNAEIYNLEINQVQLRRIELEDRLLELVDLDMAATQLMADSQIDLPEPARSKLQAAISQELGIQKEDYLNELISTYDIYFETQLYPILESEHKFIALLKEYKSFIDTRILWIQSAPMLALQDFQRLGAAVAWLFNPSSWLQTGKLLGQDMRDNILVIMPFLLLTFTLLLAQRFLNMKLLTLGRYVTKLSKAKFIDTVWAVLVTILIALAWPLFFYLIAWRILHIETDSAFVLAIGSGLSALAYLLFSGLLLSQLCRENGLGELHFRWKHEHMMLIKQQLAWYLPVMLPLIFVFVVTLEQPTEAHHESLGRLVFLILMIATTVLIYQLMHPTRGLLKQYLEKNANGWINRLSGVWFLILLITPAMLVVTAIVGYMYTAGQLSLLIINSLLLVFTVIIARALFIRWINIEQRKLAIEQWRKKFAAQEDDKTKATETGNQVIIEEGELDVETISAQTIKLLNTAFWFTIVIGFALIWAQSLPAFNMLDEVVLWNTEVINTNNGNETTSQVPITLASLVLAAVIFIMTFFISNNIPGLLEIVILQRLPFTPSGRYAIASIVRYVIIIFGFAMTFSALGIGWSKVQWLAAAVTVGLGFGLQEIFANFVSGIIILFERPVRVGDVVTLGTISGKVSRIQMRATTIIDWDRKELIIPNKEFVTDQVINWSLSDSILRIVIPVGIAYGSDTKLAHDILMSIARDHPDVLNDPEPSAHFIAFDDSSLHFELRIYIPEPDLFLETRHDVLMEIDQRFREAKIEIAFPQQDIHIRSLSEQIAIVPKSIGPDPIGDEQAIKT